MEHVETVKVGVEAVLGQFEAAFAQLERRIGRSTKNIEGSLTRFTRKLETDFGRLETKLDILLERLAEVRARAGEVGNALGRGVEGLGQLSGNRRIEGAGKVLSVLTSESPEERKFLELFAKESSELLAKFRTTERRIAALETSPRRRQLAGLGFSEAGGFGGADFGRAEESLARFHERLLDLPIAKIPSHDPVPITLAVVCGKVVV